jgi:hypothetical protein
MTRNDEHRDLLADVMAGASPPDFRAAMLGETLRMARRRRVVRQCRAVAGTVALFAITVILATRLRTGQSTLPQPVAAAVAPPSYTLVRTQPLPAGDIVTTHPEPDGQFAHSFAPLAEVTTTPGGYREITDWELLALLAQNPAALIRTGPHSEALVFANPRDQKAFQPN